MDDNLIDILKKRLAVGEISIDEYRQLMSEVCNSSFESKAQENPDLSGSLDTGSFIDGIDNFQLYKNVIVYQDKTYKLTNVSRVYGEQSSSSVNFFPTSRRSSFGVSFTFGESINISEDKTMFAGSRHDKIGRIYSALRSLTINQRITNLAIKIKQQGEVFLTKEWNYQGKVYGQNIIFRRDGMLVTPTRVINLKVAKASGVFQLGSEWRGINGISKKSNPYEVILSEKKATLGFVVPSDALKFTPSHEDVA